LKRLSAVIVILLSTLPLFGKPGKIVRAVKPVKGTYIVVLRDDDPHRPADRAAELAHRHAAAVDVVWSDALHGFSARMTEAQALAMTHNPFVDFIEEDAVVETISSQTLDSSRWGLDRIDQHNLPLNLTYNYCQDGTGVTIYIVDTGVWYLHTEFDPYSGIGNRVEHGMDFIDCPSGCTGHADSPCRAELNAGMAVTSHGTAVASVAAGLTDGVAKNATIMPVRAIDCFGRATTTQILSGINWVRSHHAAGVPAVMNCSFRKIVSDDPDGADSIDLAVNRVMDDGVVVVAGAGNENRSASSASPARVVRIMTVGGSTRLDQRWGYSSTIGSNYGSKVDLFAPAYGIKSADLESADRQVQNDGTSMAAPFVSGVAALYLQNHPTATPDEVIAWIKSVATTGVLDATTLGVGSPNALLSSASCA